MSDDWMRLSTPVSRLALKRSCSLGVGSQLQASAPVVPLKLLTNSKSLQRRLRLTRASNWLEPPVAGWKRSGQCRCGGRGSQAQWEAGHDHRVAWILALALRPTMPTFRLAPVGIRADLQRVLGEGEGRLYSMALKSRFL